jgi:hypothetical protein
VPSSFLYFCDFFMAFLCVSQQGELVTTGITSDIIDIASTDITATSTQRLLYHQHCLDTTDAASRIAFDISLTPSITGKRLWHRLLTPSLLRSNGAMLSLNLANNNLGEIVLPAGWKSKRNNLGSWVGPNGQLQNAKPGKPEGIIAIANAIPDIWGR